MAAISEQIRSAVAGADVSLYRLSKLTAIPLSSLSKFRSGRAKLSVRNLDLIGEELGLSISGYEDCEQRVSER